MTKEIEKFIQPHMLAMEGYAAHRSPETLVGKTLVAVDEIIKLDANENVYGCSPRVKNALGEYNKYHIYPDAGQTQLRQAIAAYCGTEYENIVAGCGSGELLDLLLRMLLTPGDEVINIVPTFTMYRVRVDIVQGKTVEVMRDKNFAVDVKKVLAAITARTKLIILTNPNNPDGTLTPQEDIIQLVESGLPVLVDEAYYEFCGETVLPLMKQYPNLMILRTFSKWTALAGLRVGYGIFPRVVADNLLKIKLPYNINVAAQVAVLASLADIDYLMQTVKAIINERERLFKELQTVDSLEPLPSRANYILCRVTKGNARELREKLQYHGILVRYFDRPLLNGYIRISVGKPEHTDTLLRVLREIGG